MTQQPPQQAGPGGRPGQMTAVMRAVAQTGPKVLRIGLVREGRVIEERIIKQRTHVTVGPSEKNIFVIGVTGMPASLKLFELVDNGYCLNFLDNMTGRVALPTGVSDLAMLKGQTKRAQHGSYQLRLTEDSRGKVIIGDTTFLFQFVAPPPIQPKPQLPVSVTQGATVIYWGTTMVAAFSFLVHFTGLGLIYSDWMDPVVDYDLNVAALVESIKALPAPPPVEEKKPDEAEDKKEAEALKPKPKPKAAKPEKAAPAGKTHITKAAAAALSNELESLEMATLGALGGAGPATAGVLSSSEVPTSSLDQAAASSAGVSAAGGLKVGGGGAIRPGQAGTGLANIGKTGKTGPSGSGKATKVQGPKGRATVGGANVAGGSVSNASRVVARMRAGFRACYNRALANNPDVSGRINLRIKVGPSGNITGVSASKSGNIPAAVVACVKSRARSGTFSPPEGGAAVVAVPVTFVKQ